MGARHERVDKITKSIVEKHLIFNLAFEQFLFRRTRQFTVKEKVTNIKEVVMDSQLGDGITTIQTQPLMHNRNE